MQNPRSDNRQLAVRRFHGTILDSMNQKSALNQRLGRLEHLAPFVALLAGLLPAVQPMLLGRLPRADGVFHLYRLAQLERAIRHGVLFPRWLPDLGLGYGFPLFNYYAPLSYYLALPLRLFGLSFEATLLGGFILGHGALVWGTYLWTREAFGKSAALGAAFIIGYAPYPLLNLHYRGAFAEVWGLACLAWALWALHRLLTRGGRSSFALTASLTAALTLSHNVMALVGIPLLAGYALLLISLRRDRGKMARRALLALTLGLGLAAFFWIPALREQGYVQIQQLRIYDYREYFLSLGELFAGPTPVVRGEATPNAPHSAGWIAPLLAVLGLLTLRREPRRAARVHYLALAGVTLALLAMTLPFSTPLWERLPLLPYIQFPWRFLGPASLGLAALAGVGASRLPVPERWRMPLLLGGVSFFALTWLFMPAARSQPPLTPPNLIRIERATGGLGTTVAGDYLPLWVQERPGDELLPLYEAAAKDDYLIPRLDPETLPEDARVLAAEYGLTTAQLTLETPTPFRARFRWYYFPGWQATLDGAPVAVAPDGPHGLLAVEVPAGQHTLEVRFGETPLRRAANAISIISVGLLMVGIWVMDKEKWVRSDGKWARGISSSITPRLLPVTRYLALFCIGLTLFAVKTLYLDRHDNPFHPWDFDGQQLRGVQFPLQVRFGDDLMLMGYDLESATLASDQPTALTLYWRAQQPMSTNYSVGVHLVNVLGTLYGQEDHQHPDSYPTSLLQLDEFIRDEYTLVPFAGTPPGGHYALLVTVYEAETGRHFDVWDSGGQWRGTAYQLAEITLARPTVFPALDTLPIVQRLDADLGAGLRLLGTGDLPTAAAVGNEVSITLFWQAQTTPADAIGRLQLVDGEGIIAAQADAVPGRADLPTSQWFTGEIIRDGRTFLIPAARADAPTRALETGKYTLRVSLFDTAGGPLGSSVTLGEIVVSAPVRTFDAAGRAPLARIGDFAALLEATVTPETVAPGQSFTLNLTWRAEATVGTSYTVFVHLLSETGTLIAQRDAPPVDGIRPTTSWFTSETITDAYTLSLPPETPPGIYTLKVGFYDPDTYARLPATDGAGQALGDGVTWQIEVMSNE